MQNKLQELTEKIYQEGISKGNAEAEKIIAEAKKEAENIISEAKQEADSLLKAAKKKSDEIKSNGDAELKLSSRQALAALKQQLTDLINGSVVSHAVSGAFGDKDFVRGIIETAIKNWNASSAGNMDITLLVPENDEKSLREYFVKSAKELLDKGIEIKGDGAVKSGFQISPRDGGYKISFTENDFNNFFKQYMRPKLAELLFEEK
ncbi:MAG: hypothetical protein JXB00_04840 [Bacteroidales bacterium]|nr:hypothetical protein [Bacteroidales bacterium]